jgi:hypothetical protein
MMNVAVYGRNEVEELSCENFPENVALISFSDPFTTRNYKYNFLIKPVDYSGKTDRVFKIELHDIDIDELEEYNLTYETYFPEAEKLARFIYSAKEDGLDIICQCEHGQSRSAACAAAILEHFYKTGISIFSDYRYYPNRLVFHKVLHALEKY